jgi:folate-dependent phosphoribosylglycinamide formyltransferase PurN
MHKKNLVYICSLRNAAADKAGQYINYKGEDRYMKSPLEYLVEAINTTPMGEHYTLSGVIFDDDENIALDRKKLAEYGFSPQNNKLWFYPRDIKVNGHRLESITHSVPSSYRKYPLNSRDRIDRKSLFEKSLKEKLIELKADVILLDGLLIILDELIRPESPFNRKIVNIHPGITQIDSPYERRGAYGTLDSLYGARGEKVINWDTMETISVDVVTKTGASFHYVDSGIDSGEIICDLLNTDIEKNDTIYELRWNNFNKSLFPIMYKGLMILAEEETCALNT